MCFSAVSVIAGPKIASYSLLIIAFGDGRIWHFILYIVVVALYVLSLVLLKKKSRFFMVCPFVIHCTDTLIALYQIIQTARGVALDIGVSVPMLILSCYELFEAYIFYAGITRLKDAEEPLRL